MNETFTERVKKQLEEGVSEIEIAKELKKELKIYKQMQKERNKKILKEWNGAESPKCGPGYAYEIEDLECAIATLTKYDITKSIFPQSYGQIKYAIGENPYDLFYVKDKMYETVRLEHAIRLIEDSYGVVLPTYDMVKKLKEAINKKDKNMSDKIITDFIEKLKQKKIEKQQFNSNDER